MQLDFFELYGRLLNIREVGVSCNSGGSFYSKRAKRMMDEKKPYLLSVQDPQDPTNDLSRNSYNITSVRTAFMHVHHNFFSLSADEYRSSTALLTHIIKMDSTISQRKMPSPKELCSFVKYSIDENFQIHLEGSHPQTNHHQRKSRHGKHKGKRNHEYNPVDDGHQHSNDDHDGGDCDDDDVSRFDGAKDGDPHPDENDDGYAYGDDIDDDMVNLDDYVGKKKRASKTKRKVDIKDEEYGRRHNFKFGFRNMLESAYKRGKGDDSNATSNKSTSRSYASKFFRSKS